jgi:hypothetical protein
MIRSDKILTSIFGGVGFSQTPANLIADGIPTVNAANLASTSGLKFQKANSIVTIQNIYDCQQDADISDADFNTFIGELQKDVILEVCNKITQGQSDFISSNNLYPFEKSFKNTLDSSGKFVGFEIDPCKLVVNRVGRIPWIELSFDSDKTFNIYLYNSNKPNAKIEEKEVITIANESVIVDLPEWFISDDVSYKGGRFYIGYFQDDLGDAKAIKRDYDLASYQISTPCYCVSPVTIDHTGSVIDITTATEIAETYGLNIGLEVYIDYTELLIRNKNLLWRSIQLQMGEKVLELISTSVRTNDIERITDDMIELIKLHLYGNSDKALNGKLRKSIENIQKMLFYQPRISRGTLR